MAIELATIGLFSSEVSLVDAFCVRRIAVVIGAAALSAGLIGATAAMLAIPGMTDVAAAKLAEAEGIVCHLTSLVLVAAFAGCEQQQSKLDSVTSKEKPADTLWRPRVHEF